MKARLKKTSLLTTTILVVALTLFATPAAMAAIPWDGDGGDGNWFNPANWNRNTNDNNTLPPGGDATGTAGATDTEISAGTASLNGGLGVIYDTDLPGDTGPDNPFFPVPESVNDPPSGFSYTQIAQLYISRAGAGQTTVTPDNTITIMGDLELSANMIVGRSSGSLATPTNGRVNQLSGFVKIHNNTLDMGQREGGTRIGFGNGIYDYRGGSLEAGLNSGNFQDHGIRLAAGGSAGTGGIGRFIMHNPSTPGHVRALNFVLAAHSGLDGNPAVSPNGSTIGVGTAEFHYENGGVRPIQVSRNLIINNGAVTTGTRSSRLDLVLDAAPTVDGNGVPQTLGLFDVDFAFDTLNSTLFSGAISGAGDLGLFFSSADGGTLYTEGAEITATFGSTEFKWNITYQGKISWGTCDEATGAGMVCAAADNGEVGAIDTTGGNDVVLIGLSSVSIGLPGDFNEDGIVNAADYVAWRKLNINGPAGYDDWVENFGESQPGAGGAGGVPEPGSMVLAFVAIAAAAVVRRRS